MSAMLLLCWDFCAIFKGKYALPGALLAQFLTVRNVLFFLKMI